MKRRKRPSASATPPEVSSQETQPGAASTQNPNGPASAHDLTPPRTVSAKDVDRRLPDNVLLGNDGSVTYIDDNGEKRPCPMKASSSGKLYIEFDAERGDPFKLWLGRAMHTAFKGKIPAGYEPFPLDGNQCNLKPSNLALRPKDEPRSIYKPFVPPTTFSFNGGGPN